MLTKNRLVVAAALLLLLGDSSSAQNVTSPFGEKEIANMDVEVVGNRVPTPVAAADAEEIGIARAWNEAPLLTKRMTGVNPFNSTNATAIIGRPSWNSLLDTAVDFSNKEGTLSLSLAPAFLFTPYPDWYVTNAKLTGSANTDEGTVTVGGKYDLDFTDPRYYFQRRTRQRIGAALDKEYADCTERHQKEIDELAKRKNATPTSPTESRAVEAAREAWHLAIDKKVVCFNEVLTRVLDEEFKKKAEDDKRALKFSVAGSVNYNSSEGRYDGANATLAAGWEWKEAFGFEKSSIPVTANLSYEDAIQKKDKDSDEKSRDQQAGGGFELAYRQELDVLGGNRSFEIGGAFAALACLDDPCENDETTLRLNPFLSIAISASIGGRVDVVWEGKGSDFGSAFAGLSMSYSFSGVGGGS